MPHSESINGPAIVSTTKLHKNFAEAIYESVDPDEIQYTNPDVTDAPAVVPLVPAVPLVPTAPL